MSFYVSQIVPVRYVWGGRPLAEAVGTKRFDYVIASHVIEHVPDPVGWFSEIAAVLKPGGVLSLAIPDKRWTFDCRREVTPVSAMLESFFEGHRRPTIRHFVDHFGEVAAIPSLYTSQDLWGGKVSFSQIPLWVPEFFESYGEAGLRAHFDAIKAGTYIDAHCTVFTPFSFVRILAVLAKCGLFDFRVATFQETPANEIEFFVTLEKLPDTLDAATRRKTIIESLPPLRAPLLDGEMDQVIARLEHELCLARAAACRAADEVTTLRERASALDATISRLRSSRSWRITAPLRAAKRLITGKP